MKPVPMDTIQRAHLHLAATIAGNFSTAFYTWAAQILNQNGLEFSILAGLIRETAAKAINIGPKEAQTGPAARNDVSTISKHLEMLASQPDKADLYRGITALIRSVQSTN
jgi:predicted short-subunit dehydrogenase-like oxidoreductase (DUF2520 family)